METPSSITDRIKNALEPNFRSILVEGKISSWKPSAAGHAYFNLKDEGTAPSLTGTVIRDILNVTLRRFPGLDIIFASTATPLVIGKI